MLKLHGTLLNVFQSPVGTRQDGTNYGGEYRVQIQTESILKNNEVRIEMLTMRTDHPENFRGSEGKEIVVEVGVFARNNTVHYFMHTGTEQTLNVPSKSKGV
jgi:hypothetical protein